MKKYLESEEFYNLMQEYRHAPAENQKNVTKKFNKIIKELNTIYEDNVMPKVADVKHPINMKEKENTLVTYCYNCGTKVRKQKFCHGCGYKLNWKSLKNKQ